MNVSVIEVVAAILRSRNKVLIGKRRKNDSNAGRWEFPGGKVNDGESFEGALRREIQEELGIKLSALTFFDEVMHTYTSYTVHIRFYISDIGENVELFPTSHDDLRWIELHDHEKYDFLEANRGILKKLLGRVDNSFA